MVAPLSEFKVNPLAPGAGSSMDTPEGKAYQEAITQSMQALQDRMSPQTNLYNIAAGFLKPTRGGSFGESLGNANEIMGAEQERREKEAIPIAQARAALAGQSYEMAKRAKAMQMVAGLLGTDPATASQMLSSGNMPPSMMNKFTPEVMLAVSQDDPKLAEGIKNASGMQNETIKNLLTLRAQGVDVSKELAKYGSGFADILANQGVVSSAKPTVQGSTSSAQEPIEGISQNPILQIIAGGESNFKNVPNAAGASSAFGPYQITRGTFDKVKEEIPELKDKTFEDFKQDVRGVQTPIAERLLAKNETMLKDANLSPSLLNQYSVWFSGNTKLASADRNAPIETVMDANAIAANGLKGKTVGDVMNQLKGNLAKGLDYQAAYTNNVSTPKTPDLRPGESLENYQKRLGQQSETEQSAVKEEQKGWQAKTAEVMKYDDYATKQNLGRTDQIQKILVNNPAITGLLQNADKEGVQSWMQAIGAAAQEGVKIGNFGSVSVPVEKFFSTATLTRPQKAALAELSRSISNEFFAGMKSNRGLLGVNPTDNDARLFQAAMAGTGNLVENIYSWAQSRAAEYEAMNEMYKGYVLHRKQHGTSDPSLYYTSENSPYHSAVETYGNRLNKIYGQAPGASGEQ